MYQPSWANTGPEETTEAITMPTSKSFFMMPPLYCTAASGMTRKTT